MSECAREMRRGPKIILDEGDIRRRRRERRVFVKGNHGKSCGRWSFLLGTSKGLSTGELMRHVL